MRSFAASITASATPDDVLACLADPATCADWAPFPCAVDRLSTREFRAGTRARLVGTLAGRSVAFGMFVREASYRRFSLLADGPFAIDAAYDLVATPGGGTAITATVTLGRPQGFTGRAMAAAASALLAAGLLDQALARLASEAELATVIALPGFATRAQGAELALAA